MNVTDVASSHPFDEFEPIHIRIISVTSKVPALLSLWGSLYIIYDIVGTYQRRQEKLKKAYHRIILGLSISDCIVSIFGWFITTWLIPKDYLQDQTVWGNNGTWGTCDAQGFLVHVGGFCSAYYTALLTFYYLLSVKYEWKEQDFRKKARYFHGGIWGFAFISATILLVKGLFNPEIPFCYIQSYPFGCEFADDIECIRGENLLIYQLVLFFGPVCIAFSILSYSMGALIIHARKQETRIMRLSTVVSSPNESESRRLSKMVFKRALRYVAAYLIVWFPSAMYLAAILIAKTTPFVKPGLMLSVLLLMEVLSPLQGLLNALIYTQSNLLTFCKNTYELIFYPTLQALRKSSDSGGGPSSEL